LGHDAIGLAMAQEQQYSRWIGNGARPSGSLESDARLSDDAAKRLKDRWENFKSGIQNTGSTVVLEEGLKWKQMALNSVDLEFINARQFQIPEVCRLFGVPPHKIFVVDRAASMSIPQQDQDYVNSTIAPDLERWEQKLEQFFDLDRDGINVHFDEGQLLRADVNTRFQTLRVGILTGIITPNEARETEVLPPLPGGDNLLIPANTAALGSEMTGTGADEAGRPPGGQIAGPKVGTGGDQPTATDKHPGDPEMPGAEELQPSQSHSPAALRAIPVERRLILSGVPVRHQAKIRARLRAKRVASTSVIRALEPPPTANLQILADLEPETRSEPQKTSPAAMAQPIALTVNVDAAKPAVRRIIRKAEDGTLEIIEAPANDNTDTSEGAA
jgi:hypothetical protein